MGHDIECDEGGQTLAAGWNFKHFMPGEAGGNGLHPGRGMAGEVRKRQQRSHGADMAHDVGGDRPRIEGVTALPGDEPQCPGQGRIGDDVALLRRQSILQVVLLTPGVGQEIRRVFGPVQGDARGDGSSGLGHTDGGRQAIGERPWCRRP